MYRLNESKESTLNKCINLTQEQKADALEFFNGKGQSLWGSIDWNKPRNVTWSMIEELKVKASQSNQQMKKRMKNLNVGLNDIQEGIDYNVTYRCDEYTLYHALSHKGACVLASNDVFPQVRNQVPNWAQNENNEWWEKVDGMGYADGAHWCISLFRTSTHWDDYTNGGANDFYVFCYTGDRDIWDRYRKVCIDLDEENNVVYWSGDDDSFDPEEEVPFDERLEELLVDASKRLYDTYPLSDEALKSWASLVRMFGGMADARMSNILAPSDRPFEVSMVLNTYGRSSYETWDDVIRDSNTDRNMYAVTLKFKVPNVNKAIEETKRFIKENIDDNGFIVFDSSVYVKLVHPLSHHYDIGQIAEDIKTIIFAMGDEIDISKDDLKKTWDEFMEDKAFKEFSFDENYNRNDGLTMDYNNDRFDVTLGIKANGYDCETVDSMFDKIGNDGVWCMYLLVTMYMGSWKDEKEAEEGFGKLKTLLDTTKLERNTRTSLAMSVLQQGAYGGNTLKQLRTAFDKTMDILFRD